MKKCGYLILLVLPFVGISQVININTSTYTVPQLVTNILVNKPCIPVTNITWRTGTNFGSSNGIGYFTNTNPDFPMQSGVVLSTGNVANAPGPNTTQLDDGNAAWTGDTDLEATLLASGITMASTNATVLEFDFTPFSPNFDFKFLFASEEYGNFQCRFSDAFAFLLTNTATGVTTNLAVVPGTTLPISVVTIRDFLYNSGCASVNPSFFGRFNGGSAAAGSATNFNGQTVEMSASSSTLIPNTTYHIKLVIADRLDNRADSAIFLASNSFNIGQDVLGEDYTATDNTAICNNSTTTLTSGLNPAVYSFAWTLDGNPIGGNTPNLTVNQPGTYGLTYTIISSNCIVTTDFKKVEYFSAITTPDPIDLYKCNSGFANYNFNLGINNNILNFGNSTISYHASATLANSNGSPLPTIYNVANTSLPQTIYAKILNNTTGCFIVKSFQLALTAPPIANNPGNLTICESSAGTANFPLTTQISTILGLQSSSIYETLFFANASNANAGSNPINVLGGFSSASTQVFIRVQNITDPTCFAITSINLITKPTPLLDQIPDQYVCINYTLPVLVNSGNYYSAANQGSAIIPAGTVITVDSDIFIYNATGGIPNCDAERSFRVEIVEITEITPPNINQCDRYILPALPFGTRYFTLPGGPTGGGTEILPGAVISNPGVTTINIYFVSTNLPICILESSFTITITITPTITGTFPNLFDCTAINSLPTLALGNYYTYDVGTDIYTPLTLPITATTDVYVFATNGICKSADIVFTAVIGSLNLPNVTECLSFTLPILPIGEYRDAPNGGGNIIPVGTIISTTSTIYTYVPGASCTNDDFFTITIQGPFLTTPTPVTSCATYTIPVQPDGGNYYTLSGGPTTAGNVQLLPNVATITTTTTIYIYKASSTIGCFNEKPWLININHKPIIDSRGNVEQCSSYTLTPLVNGNYFDNPNGISPLSAGTVITTNNTIYIYAANVADPTCFSQNSFYVVINGVSTDPIPTQLVYCNTFTFPVLPTLGNNYYTLPGGPTGGGTIILAGTTVNISTVQTTPYFIYYETGNRLNCSDEKSFTITIVPRPIADAVSPIRTCDTFNENEGLFEFNLTAAAIRNDVLNGALPDADFTLSFYTSLLDANNPLATPISNPATYVNDNPITDSVWIRVANNKSTTDACFDVVELPLIIDLLPNPKLLPEYFICSDFQTGTLLNPVLLNSEATGANLQFNWTFNGLAVVNNTNSLLANEAGNYTLLVTNTATNCKSKLLETKVTSYAPYLEIVYSDAFDDLQYITVNVLGSNSGSYLYQIDDEPFQESNQFLNVSPGNHSIQVRDKTEKCNPKPIEAIVINYPKYFTPNSDGFNDTWNIPNLIKTNPNTPINIFDRFGKLLKVITPSSPGWNGNFNGEPLPATDYWFTVSYDEKGAEKIFKSHFALKR